MATYAFDNAAQSVTSSTVASGATTVTLSATSLFDASGKQYIVRADDSASTAYMYCLVTGNNTATNVLTWTEGVDGTSAIALGNASTVTEVITKKTITDTIVRLDTAVSQTLTGPLVIPTSAGGSTATTSYGSTWVKIDDQLLASTAATITFVNPLPTGFRHLLIDWYARGDTAAVVAEVRLHFNNDGAANYDYEQARANASAWSVAEVIPATFISLGRIPAANATANYFGSGDAKIRHYNGAVGNKQVVSTYQVAWDNLTGDQETGIWSGKWRTTATAVTRIDLFPSAGNFLTGSLFTLWGIP